MKSYKKYLKLFSALIFVGILVSCGNKGSLKEDKKIVTYEQASGIELSTEDGFYHFDNKGFLYFFDYKTREDVIVCSKKDCKHEPWTKDTPVEERCEAYFLNGSRGFVLGDNLYMISTLYDSYQLKTQIIRSNLDRSEAKVIAKFDYGMISSFSISDGKLYLPISAPIYIKDKAGGFEPSGRAISNLICVDLKSGKTEKLIEDRENYSGYLNILASDNEKIYLKYSFFKNKFKGNNFKESQARVEYFSYDVKTNKVDKILKNIDDDIVIQSAKIKGKSLIAYTFKYDDKGQSSKHEIRIFNIDEGSSKVIAESQEMFIELGASYFFKQKGKEGYAEFNSVNEKIVEHGQMTMENLFPFTEAGDFYYLSIQKPDKPSYHGFILKEDFLKGNIEKTIKAH